MPRVTNGEGWEVCETPNVSLEALETWAPGIQRLLRKDVEEKLKDWTPAKEQKKLKVEEETLKLRDTLMAAKSPGEAEIITRFEVIQEGDVTTIMAKPPARACDEERLKLLGLQWLGVTQEQSPEEWHQIEAGISWKVKRTLPHKNAFVRDYAEYGWPKSAGPSARYVTWEEDREIRRRMEEVGLTLPGSQVVNTSKTLRQVFESDAPVPVWTIEGLLRDGGAAMIYGPAGVGKTMFTHALVMMMAHGCGCGMEFLKAGEHEGKKVLLVDGEMIETDIRDRMKVMVEGLGVGVEALENVTLYAKTVQDHRADFVDLAKAEWRTQILDEVRARGYEVVVLDNLSTLQPSLKDENDATSWVPLNELIVGLKGAGVATVIVHHSGKSGDFRGSSAIVTALETVVKLKQVEPVVGYARFRVEITKSRAQGVLGIHGKTLALQEGKWAIEVDENQEAKELVERVMTLKYTTQAELADAVGRGQGTVSKLLKGAVALGLCKDGEVTEAFKKAREFREAMAFDDETSEI